MDPHRHAAMCFHYWTMLLVLVQTLLSSCCIHKHKHEHDQPTSALQHKPGCCAGFNSHKRPLPKAREVLDDISQAKPPSRFLEEAADQKKAALQLGTLGGGNHFLGECVALLSGIRLSVPNASPHQSSVCL